MKCSALLIALIVSGCSATQSTAPVSTADELHKLHDIWVLDEVNGRTITRTDYDREAPRLELNTAEMRAMGHTSCNSFSGSFTATENSLKFGPIASTKMFCEKSVETEFLAVLHSVDRYRFEANRLLFLKNDQVIAKFRKVD
jgi:heat shock protein HslJ